MALTDRQQCSVASTSSIQMGRKRLFGRGTAQKQLTALRPKTCQNLTSRQELPN